MGDFTDKFVGSNGSKAGAIPADSKHYEMAGLSFYLNKTPKQVFASIVQNVVAQLTSAGHFEAAKQMVDNPQPFAGEPAAMALFMATCEELARRDERIDKLEGELADLRNAMALRGGPHVTARKPEEDAP